MNAQIFLLLSSLIIPIGIALIRTPLYLKRKKDWTIELRCGTFKYSIPNKQTLILQTLFL